MSNPHSGRRNRGNRRQDLPPPYNQDLSQILRNLNRRTPFGRKRLANDPVTAAYLVASDRLVKRHLGPDAQRMPADPEDENSVPRPLLGFLSMRAVVAEVDSNPPPFPRRGSMATLRCTWRSHSGFIADVIRFHLWSESFATRYADMPADAASLRQGRGSPEAVHNVSCWDLKSIIDLPMFRLELIAAASAEGDGIIGEALTELYQQSAEWWKCIYKDFLASHHLEPRHPGLTVDQFSYLLAATAEGLALRHMADPKSPVLDEGQGRSMLGTVALALILACTHPIGQGDGRTLEQAVDALLERARNGQ